MSNGFRYRVEHHDGSHTAVLGQLEGVALHPSSLDAYVSRLLHEGSTGWVVLVSETSGRIAARRRIHTNGRPARTSPRQRGTSPLLQRSATMRSELLRADSTND